MTQSPDDPILPLTRREFIKSTALATAALATAGPAASLAQTSSAPIATSQRLLAGWEHCRGSLGGIWEVWRGGRANDKAAWQSVTLPHCFNARDAVDPD